jgi:hypothetical protein
MLLTLLLLIAGSLGAQTDRTDPNAGFDKPTKKTVVDLGPSPHYRPTQHVRKKLTCYYYSRFTVKEYDEGQKGAEWMSIVPSGNVACTPTHRKDEKVYNNDPEWWGYFWGAKGTVAFSTAPDGTDGGLPFTAFEATTGRKLFEDSSPLDYYTRRLHITNAFRVRSDADQILRLTYYRVVAAGCDIKTEQALCWNKIKQKLGLTQARIPVCAEYNHVEGTRESAVVYPVTVRLTDSPQIKPIDGPVFCWPTD